MTEEKMREFFKKIGHLNIDLEKCYGDVEIEFLYQAFKSRLISECYQPQLFEASK